MMLVKSKSKEETLVKGKYMCQMVQVKTNFDTEIEVADIKKDIIENIVEVAGICTRIRQIILFGSVIESRCTEDSDVDMLVVSDISRSRLYKDKGYREFLKKLHDKDDYEQMYDVICVHGMDEVYQKQDTVCLFRDVIENGKTLYRRV